MLSQIVLILLAWLPTPILRVATERSEPAPPSAEHAVVLWLDGEVTVTARGAPEPDVPEGSSPPAASAPVIGEVLAAPATIRVPPRGRLTLLVGGDRLVRLRRGHYTLDQGGLRVVSGPAPRATPLGGYREGSLLIVSPPTSYEPPPELPLSSELLRITSPAPTVIREQRPLFEWRTSVTGGRFDLTLRRVEGEATPPNESAEGELIEQWRGLGGRALLATATLRRGGRYRLTIALAGGATVAKATSRTIAFEVLGGVEERALDGARGALEALRDEAGGLEPELEVLRARLFESYGLLADAERIWAGLALLEPGRAELRNQARRLEGLIHRSGGR